MDPALSDAANSVIDANRDLSMPGDDFADVLDWTELPGGVRDARRGTCYLPDVDG